jgi:ankyrin repeat protein
MAARLLKGNPQVLEASGGALHLVTQRNDLSAVQWLLDKGADVDGRWSSAGAIVTPLHLAASRGHAALVRSLLEAGADPTIRDSMHDSDPLGWAEYFQKPEIVQILRDHLSR